LQSVCQGIEEVESRALAPSAVSQWQSCAGAKTNEATISNIITTNANKDLRFIIFDHS
jgi:hypothetical protein